jgi:hypothetical protein
MPLRLQDPENALSPYLLESLLEAFSDATSAGGFFAWATSTGLELLLRDPTVTRFAKLHKFDLVVGLDLVTDARALKKMQEISSQRPNIRTKVFLHSKASALFHPKTCWFRRAGKGGTLIAGSGNLTVGGLRANWEAYSVTPLTEAQAKKVEHEWHEWQKRHAAKIIEPSSKEAVERATKNAGWNFRPRLKAKTGIKLEPKPPEEKPGEASPQVIDTEISELVADDSPVLVAEIPKASDRWNQANFDLATYENFFGAKVGTQRRILLQHVKTDGALEDLETRPSVEVKSRNFRFELQAASGIPYPAKGRPIAVFIRQLTGVFLYRLVLPSDPAYGEAVKLLVDLWKGRADRMRRVTTDVATLKKYWPTAPFWKVTTMPE